MKNVKISFVLFVSLFTLISISSCNNNDDAMQPINERVDVDRETINEVKTNLQAGTWRITKFMEDDRDETNDFAGFDFTFEGTGKLSATNGTETFEGTWSITDSDPNDDDASDDDLDFNIYCDLTYDFEDLNDDWDFISRSATKIELIDISGGDGGIDLLTFEKN